MKKRNQAFYLAITILASTCGIYAATQSVPSSADEDIIQQLADSISKSLTTLFDTTKNDIDALYKETLTNVENSSTTYTSFKAWLDYLANNMFEEFDTKAQEKIDAFKTNAKDLPLVDILAQNNIYLNYEIDNLAEKLDTYKETLKDELYKLSDEYIEKVDLREMAYQEQMGQLGTISWTEKLKDLSEEKRSSWQSIKDFASSAGKEFMAQAKPAAEQELKTAGNTIVQETKTFVSQEASTLAGGTLGKIKSKLTGK